MQDLAHPWVRTDRPTDEVHLADQTRRVKLELVPIQAFSLEVDLVVVVEHQNSRRPSKNKAKIQRTEKNVNTLLELLYYLSTFKDLLMV
jgi:hypothetical protein